MDRWLLTWFFAWPKVYDDTQHLRYIKILKYTPFIFLIATELVLLILRGTGVNHSLGILGSKKTVIDWIFFWFPVILVVELIIKFRGGLDFFHQVRDKTSVYFSRIGHLDRLKWLVFETWMRQEYNMKMIDDVAFEALKDMKSIPQGLMKSNPPNFNILSNYLYWDKLGFKAADLIHGSKSNTRSN